MNPNSSVAKNARIGLALFSVYLIFYGVFVYLSAFNSELMAEHAFAGVNIAVVYGFGLIVAALVLALVYLKLCYPADDARDGGEPS